MKHIPRSLRLLSEPKQVFHELHTHDIGMGIVFFWLLLEFILVRPSIVASSAMRIVGAPKAAFIALWSGLTNYALQPAFSVAFLGMLFYFARRAAQKPKLDYGPCMAIFAYAYVPHTLCVAAGLLIAWAGFDHVLLPQYSLQQAATTSVLIAKIALAYGPSIIFSIIGMRVLWDAHSEENRASINQQTVAAVLAIFLIATSAGSVAINLKQNWQKVRPLLVGDTLFDFNLATLDGPPLDTQTLRGRVILIDFWATWCPPCIASMPHLQELVNTMSNAGVAVVPINIEPMALDRVREFLKQRNLTLPIYIDDGHLQERFHVHAYPTSFLIDRKGVIRKIYAGPVENDELQSAINSLL